MRAAAGAGGRRAARVSDPGPPRFAASNDGLLRGAEQARDDVHRPRGIEHVHNRLVELGRNLHGRVLAAGGGAADEQRDREAPALHLARHEHHLVERRRDEAAEADQVGAFVDRRLQDLVGRDHHAEVHDLVVVAPEDDADDVLADVVDVALDRRHDDLALRTACRRPTPAFPPPCKAGGRPPLSSSRARSSRPAGRNILPAPNRSPTIFMPSISGPSMTSSGRGSVCRASSTSCSMKSTTPWTSAWASRCCTTARRATPGPARAWCRRP